MESPARCRYAYNYVGDFLGDAKDGGNDLVLHPTLNFGVDGLGWHAPEYSSTQGRATQLQKIEFGQSSSSFVADAASVRPKKMWTVADADGISLKKLDAGSVYHD